MHRRTFLGAAVGGTALLAGCYRGSGDTTGGEPTRTATETATPTTLPALTLSITGVSETGGGALVATVEVQNNVDGERTGTVTLTAAAGDTSQTVTREVTVGGRDTETVSLTFSNVSRTAFAESGSFPTATVEAA